MTLFILGIVIGLVIGLIAGPILLCVLWFN